MNSLAPEMDRRVWPPILVGKRKACFTVPYVHDDSDANVKVTLAARFMTFLQSAISLKAITVESLKCDQCPVYVFPPSVEAFIRASYMDGHCETQWVRAAFPKLMAGWTLKYAVVEDMARIDPYRRLVNWFAIDEHKGISKDVPFQGRLKGNILSFLKMMTFRKSHMKKAFALDEVRVSNASFERLNSLGVLMGGEREHAAKVVTSRLIDRGTQRELETIQRMTDEIQRAKATKRRLRELKLDHLTSSRLLVEKQNKELMQHLVGWTIKSQTLMEEAMLSRIKFNTFLRQTEKEAYILQQLISSGATEIVEEVNRDALKEQEQELTKRAKTNQECCICYEMLEGFFVATSQDGEKLHKRACFLPCMHANVCTTCSEDRWNEGPKDCPICCEPLTERPRIIYL